MLLRFNTTEFKAILSDFSALMLLGPRQVGKTTLAHVIAQEIDPQALFLDLEQESDRTLIENNAEPFLMTHKERCVVIDEVQVLPKLFTELRPIIDAYRVPGRFILLGSANPAMVQGVSESLAGRVIYQEVFQLSLVEIIPYSISMEEHWFKGGFPEALLTKTTKAWALWTQSFISAYVHRDLNALFGVNLTSNTIEKLWTMLCHLNGQIENAENLSKSLGITGATTKRYIDFLEGAYLVKRLPAWYINHGKRLVKASKLYIRTSGLLHYMLHIRSMDDLQRHPALGASWEAYVIEQLSEFKPEGTSWYFYRTHNGAEVDLVLVAGMVPIACIEIKYTNAPTLTRGFYECVKDLQTVKNYVITPGSTRWLNKEGVIVVDLASFIQEDLPQIAQI